MNYTTNLNLNKPEPAEQYNIQDWNDNSDIIDSAIQNEIDERKNETVELKSKTESLNSNLDKLSTDFNNFKNSLSYTAYSNDLFSRYTFNDTVIAVATTENINLLGTQVIDGIPVISGQFVLVKDQSEKSQNGVYEVTSGAWIRLGQGDSAEIENLKYKFFKVENGNVNSRKVFYSPSDFLNFTLESDSITFSEYQKLKTEQLDDSSVSTDKLQLQALFNIFRPVGSVYTQYPQQASPMDLWGSFSTWEVVDYDGAFFRAAGGNANAFIEKSGNLVKQGQSLLKHSHTGTTSEDGLHRHYFNYDPKTTSGGAGAVLNRGSATQWTNEAGLHSHTFTTDKTGEDENRPDNFTVRIWLRTA